MSGAILCRRHRLHFDGQKKKEFEFEFQLEFQLELREGLRLTKGGVSKVRSAVEDKKKDKKDKKAKKKARSCWTSDCSNKNPQAVTARSLLQGNNKCGRAGVVVRVWLCECVCVCAQIEMARVTSQLGERQEEEKG